MVKMAYLYYCLSIRIVAVDLHLINKHGKHDNLRLLPQEVQTEGFGITYF